MKYTATPDEIDMLVKRNESFKGKKPNFEKMRAYQQLKETCAVLASTAACVKHLEEVPPGWDHRHAIVALDVAKATRFTGNEAVLFQRAVELSDGFMLFDHGETPRLSFTVINVWED